MKPAAAFSIGLWAGAAVVLAVGLFYRQNADRPHGSGSLDANTKLAAQMDQIRVLEQDNARLSAELQRFKETTSVLKSNLDSQSETDETTVRRIPFARPTPPAEAPPPEPAPDAWVEQAVAGADASTLPALEKLALKNNRRALEAIARLSDLDQAATLTRVWRSGLLSLPRLADATRYLAATMEVNPEAEQLLRGVATDPNADPRVVLAVVDGLANPSAALSQEGAGPDVSGVAHPHFKPDYAERIRLLDSLRSSVTNDDVRAELDQAKAELQTHLPGTNPPVP